MWQQEQSWMWVAKATVAQKTELRGLIAKLGWTEEFYIKLMPRTIDEMYWLEIISCISGAQWLADNPRSWKIGDFKTISDLQVKQQSLYAFSGNKGEQKTD